MAKSAKKTVKRASVSKNAMQESPDTLKDIVLGILLIPFVILRFLFRFLYNCLVKVPYNSNMILGFIRTVIMFVVICALSKDTGNILFGNETYYEPYIKFVRHITPTEGIANLINFLFSAFIFINLIVQLCVMLGLKTKPRFLTAEQAEYENNMDMENAKYPAINKTMEALDSALSQESTHGKIRYLKNLFGGGN